MIKVTIQPKSGQLVTRTLISLLASAIDLVEGFASGHAQEHVKQRHDPDSST